MNRNPGLSLQKFNEFERSNAGSSRLKAVDSAATAAQCSRHLLALVANRNRSFTLGCDSLPDVIHERTADPGPSHMSFDFELPRSSVGLAMGIEPAIF
ncbi:MAG TPA: hypothetical protein VFT69_19605 [Pseudolabrys sp.]|nr:hypothetical protein [Pseudolabrys sp.]